MVAEDGGSACAPQCLDGNCVDPPSESFPICLGTVTDGQTPLVCVLNCTLAPDGCEEGMVCSELEFFQEGEPIWGCVWPA